MFKQRVITALVLLPLFVSALLYLPTMWLGVLFGAVLLLGAREWLHMFPFAEAVRRAALAVFAGLLVLGLVLAGYTGAVSAVLAFTLVWWAVALYWIIRAQRSGESQSQDVAAWMPGFPVSSLAVGFMVLWSPFVALLALHQAGQSGPKLALYCLTLMWVADTAAYFVGRKFGRRKLASLVSPGKSWEGALGALAVTAIWSVLGGVWLGLSATDMLWFVPLSVVTAAFSVVGDLFESLIKRHAHIKDSGQLLPGHGGVLDRIDSITAGAPLFGLGILWLAKL